MAFNYFDRVKETSTTTGTGAISLGGAVSSFVSFSSVYNNADTMFYCITDQAGNNWEIGIGTYNTSGNTLSRSVLVSSNADALVNFTSGALFVYTTIAARQFQGTTGGTTGTGNIVLSVSPAITGTASFANITASGTISSTGTLFAQNNLSVGGTAVFSNPFTLPNGSTATTQSSADNSTKVATTAFVQTATAVPAAHAVGSNVLASYNIAGTLAVGSTTAGSNLIAQRYAGGGFTSSGDTLPGTWQALQTVVYASVGLFQRVS